jgi:hypothetical protein
MGRILIGMYNSSLKFKIQRHFSWWLLLKTMILLVVTF